MVDLALLDPLAYLPFAVTPRLEGVVLNPWIERNADRLRDLLQQHGALLFRGFGIDSPERFAQAASTLSPNLMAYGERSSPCTKVAEGVYTSTDHPADQPILLHTEQLHTPSTGR